MAQAIISSSSVIPDAEPNEARSIRLWVRPCFEMSCNIAIVRTITLRLNLQRRFARNQWYQLLLRIFRIHLHNGQV